MNLRYREREDAACSLLERLTIRQKLRQAVGLENLFAAAVYKEIDQLANSYGTKCGVL